MKSWLKWIGIVLILVVAAACSQQEEESAASEETEETEGIEVQHELGTTTVPENAEDVVTLELGVTETVAALGIKPVGVADDDRPERIAASTMEVIEGYKSVGARSEPSLELIRTLQPDVIIADVDRHEAIYEELSAIAPTVAVVNDAADYQDVLTATETIGKALDREDETEELLDEHQTMLNDLKENLEGVEGTVLQAQYTESNIFGAPTSSFFMPSFMEEAGLDYALQNEEETSEDLTIEQLLKIDPDTLLLTKNEDDPSVKEQLKDDKLWNQLTAVKEDRVFELNHNDWSRRRSIPAVNERMDQMKELFAAGN
ncbi:ABC transporter substrate-binding protein [Halobacillus litoralis]|uniref:ABC transporter substrate-binding protein n=1 Tax=Halobacillus litoralis TaxID=45668 RepID=A0A845E4I8_9BACI|nr:ABC transporter substrate-binding protein [Halobacillus litoralis]MYL20584.1 ABC transporter substrate-binding protein [Halobacillus litoralis]